MTDITISLTDSEYKALQTVAMTPEFWANNVVKERCRVATDDIVRMYTDRALNESISIPATRDLIIEDALARGWVKTKVDEQAEFEAAMAEQANTA